MRRVVLASVLLSVLACAKAPAVQPTHRGLFLGSNSLSSFTPCGEAKLWWVEGPASFGLQSRYRVLARRPFQPIYVELLAQYQPRSNRMPMEGHDGYLRVDSVLRAQLGVPADCKLVAPEP